MGRCSAAAEEILTLVVRICAHNISGVVFLLTEGERSYVVEFSSPSRLNLALSF